jgi:hypothetical protein
LTLEGEQSLERHFFVRLKMIFHSSNTWVGNIKPYVKTETSHQTPNNVVSASLHALLVCVSRLNGLIVFFLWRWQFYRQVFTKSSPIKTFFELNIGIEYIDQVTIGPDLVIHNQSIGVAFKVSFTSLFISFLISHSYSSRPVSTGSMVFLGKLYGCMFIR